MMETQELCGLFGKVPQQADFVSQHLPTGFTEHWHAWMQAALSVSREQLGDDWLDLYLTSPVWRFAIGAGVCCERPLVGVLIPSVDEVGRYFPLTVAHAGPHSLWGAYLSGADWFTAAERVALSALDERTGYMKLIEGLEALPLPELQALPQYRTLQSDAGPSHAWMVPEVAGASPTDAVLGLVDKVYSRLLGGYSLWWTHGSDQVDPCLLISAGLPESGQVAAMLDGDWARWGWCSEQVMKPAAEPA